MLERNPFETLDEGGVGDLMRIAVERGRGAKPDLKLGICGEHGGDPRSVHFCHAIGLDYVSCSPFRVPLARLAAAQAALAESGVAAAVAGGSRRNGCVSSGALKRGRHAINRVATADGHRACCGKRPAAHGSGRCARPWSPADQSPATQTITPTACAEELAAAIASDTDFVTGAAFEEGTPPPEGTPNAVADSGSALTGFPTGGSTFALLSSGDSTLADKPNNSAGSVRQRRPRCAETPTGT